eukprot:3172877-Rhodomonas_salina.1
MQMHPNQPGDLLCNMQPSARTDFVRSWPGVTKQCIRHFMAPSPTTTLSKTLSGGAEPIYT